MRGEVLALQRFGPRAVLRWVFGKSLRYAVTPAKRPLPPPRETRRQASKAEPRDPTPFGRY